MFKKGYFIEKYDLRDPLFPLIIMIIVITIIIIVFFVLVVLPQIQL